MARKIKISVSGQTSSIYLMCSDCPSGQKPSWNGISLIDFLSSSNLYSNTVEIEVDNDGILLLPYGKTNNKFYSYTIEGDTKLSKDETLIINISSHAGSGTFRLEMINITIDLALTEYLTNVANAIRNKKGTSDKINAQDFPKEIENLPSGGADEDTLYTELLNGSYGSEQTVNITLRPTDGGLNNQTSVAVKFGSQPSDDSDTDYYAFDGSSLVDTKTGAHYKYEDNLKIDVAPVAYIWQRKDDIQAGYSLNGMVFFAGVGYANATKVNLKDGDIINLRSTGLD